MKKIKAIDFFCSGGGMSYGMQSAGVDILAGIDFDKDCKETYLSNIKNAKYICEDVSKLDEEKLEKELGIKKNDKNLIMIGCSPCQYWTIIRTNKEKSKQSKNLLHEFYRFVEYYKPGFVVVENVPGILNKMKESGLDKFIENLENLGYIVEYKIVNMNDYGVAESRRRFSLVANRVTKNKIFPKEVKIKKVLKDVLGIKNGFKKIKAGHKDDTNTLHTCAGLSDVNLKRLKMTAKNGGSRSSWAKTDLQIEAYKKANNVSFNDTYGRMSWDKPAPTITTKFFSISNGRFAHPEEDRAISLREGATIQSFPKNYTFISGSISGVARMIGNAVPPLYAKKIGEAIIKEYE